MGTFCYTSNMVKNLIKVDEEKTASNTFAGVALLATLSVLYFYLHPSSLFEYAVNLAFALVVGGVVYFSAEFIRKRMSK